MIFRRDNDNKQNSAADSGDPTTMEQSAMPPQNAGGFAMPSVGGAAMPTQASAVKEEAPEDALGNLEVSSGQMTFDAEGNDNPNSPYFTRSIHYPPVGNSGVTVGRGYDMGSRSSKEILGHMEAAGVPSDKASLLSKAAGKKGEAAQEFVRDYKDKIGYISHSQQKQLFNIVYSELKKDAMRISNKKDVIAAYGETDFDTLHPAISDLLVDLRYRGDYKPSTRKWIQSHIANNDLEKLSEIMADSTWMTKYGVPKDRFNRRKEFMQNAMLGNPQVSLRELYTETADQGPSMTAIHYGTVDAPSGLNVRSGVGVSNSKVGLLGDGEEVTVYEEKDGWLRIGENEWVHGGFINKTSIPQEPELAEPIQGPPEQIIEAPQAESALFPGMVTATQLNVRSSGSGDAEKVGVLNQGDSVQIFEQKGAWVRIGENEWVHGSYVKITPKQEEPEIVVEEPKENGNVEEISTGTVSASALNVRDEASGDGNKVGMLKNGDSVQIYEQKGDWIRIGEGRWVHGNYVDITKEEVKEEAKPEVKEQEAETESKDQEEKTNEGDNTFLDGTWLDGTWVEDTWVWTTRSSSEEEEKQPEQTSANKVPEPEVVPVTAEPAKEKEQIVSMLDDLMKQDRLSAEDIKTVRGEIEKVEDVEEKKKLYQNLASKVEYSNQRQSVVKDENGAYAEKILRWYV